MSRSDSCAVLFDLYGTLVDIHIDEADPLRWERTIELARRAGVTLDENPVGLREKYRRRCAREVAMGSHSAILNKVLRSILEDSGEHGAAPLVAFARAFREATLVDLALRRYALELLDLLRDAKVRIGLVSNTEGILTRYDLDRVGLADSFDATVLSSEVGNDKPQAGIFATALTQLEVEPSRAAMIGDTYDTDVLGARAARIRAMHLDPAMRPGSVRMLSGADAIQVHPDLTSIVAGLRVWGLLGQ